jgi:hypothetical protein
MVQRADDVAKHMIQERREGFGGPYYAGARRVPKPGQSIATT